VSRGVPLGVALCALPISPEIILRLLQSGNGSSQAEGHRISHALPGQLELLPRNKRSRVWNIAHIEIRNETERTLLLLFLDLLFGYFDLRRKHPHFGVHRSHYQNNLRNRIALGGS